MNADTSLDVIRRNRQVVTLDGDTDVSLWCLNVTKGSGVGATQALFSCPQLLWDANRSSYVDKLVAVRVSNPYDGHSSAHPDFLGYLDEDSASVSPDRNEVTFSAHSCAMRLNRVFVGQETHQSVVRYTLFDRSTGLATAWTPLKVLEDIFEQMPSYYRARFGLGDTSAIRKQTASDVPELVFRLCSVKSAVEQVMACWGDVAVRERFTSGNKVLLDFYRIQGGNGPEGTVRVCDYEDPITSNSNVATIQHNGSSADAVTRVIGYGTPRRYMVTCKNYVGVTGTPADLMALGEQTAAKRLVADWNSAYEPAVLLAPQCAQNGSLGYGVQIRVAAGTGVSTLKVKSGLEIWANAVLQVVNNGEQMRVISCSELSGDVSGANYSIVVERGYLGTVQDNNLRVGQILTWLMPGIERVFRSFRLPQLLWPYTKQKANAWKRTNGEDLDVQVWKYIRARVPTYTGGVITGMDLPLQAVPSLIPNGCSIDLDKNTIVLKQPALQEKSFTVDGSSGQPVVEYERAVIGVTFTFEGQLDIYFDTGTDGNTDVSLDLHPDGLTESWKRDDLTYARLGTRGFPLSTQEWDCLFFDVDTSEWVDVSTVVKRWQGGAWVTTTESLVITDDTAKLRSLCRELARERNRRHHSYSIEIPYFTRGYEIGQRLRILGQANYKPGSYMITDTRWAFGRRGEQRTILTVDNVKPPVRIEG